ncbi:MAG: lipid A biosynthesis acyltransferase [Pseudomonadota bacterium]
MPWPLKIRYLLEYGLLRLVIGFVRLFPLDLATNTSARITQFVSRGGRRHKKAMENLKTAFPDMSEEEREAILMDMWDNIGRVIVETMQIDRILAEPERIEVEDMPIVLRYKDKMGAVIVATMHYGNWELASYPLSLAGSPIAGVYRLINNPYVDEYIMEKRKTLYPGGLFGKAGYKGRATGFETARMLGSLLRQRGRSDTASLGFIADVYDRNGISVPFFGQDVKFTPFPCLLARRLNTRMWIGRCERIGKASRFRINAVEVKIPKTENEEEDIREIAASVYGHFEQWIRENPGQFMWSNKRFV